MALPEDHLVKFHFMADAKDIWEAIKSIFCGNDESKKMQKYLLKQQFKGFSVSSSEGLHKGYDRFQTLMGQLEINGADINDDDLEEMDLKWQVAMISMRIKKFQEIWKKVADIDWSAHVEEDTKNYVIMAYSNLGSDNETTCDSFSTGSGTDGDGSTLESDSQEAYSLGLESDSSVE
nr:ribonuclease H-like domain-containing protein [Tanacetum cinerariifolium]